MLELYTQRDWAGYPNYVQNAAALRLHIVSFGLWILIKVLILFDVVMRYIAEGDY